MKIIGQTDVGYLVAASYAELQQIAGFDVINHTSTRGYRGSPIGTEFNVSGAWYRIKDLDRRHEELTKAAGAMRALADMLTDKLEVVALPSEPKAETDG